MTEVSQVNISRYIPLVFCMLSTIEFNDEAALTAYKINEKWPYRFLTDEFEARQLA